MRRSTKSFVGTVAALAISAGVGTAAVAASGQNHDPQSEQRTERQYTDAHAGEAGLSRAQAEHLGTAARPGSVVESHLETESHGLRWEVKTDDGSHVWEVQLDPSTGRVVSNQPEE